MSISPFILVQEQELDPEIYRGKDAIMELGHLESPQSPVKEVRKEMHPWCRQFIEERLCRPAEDPTVQDSLALFRAAGWRNGNSKRIREGVINIYFYTDPLLFFMGLPS